MHVFCSLSGNHTATEVPTAETCEVQLMLCNKPLQKFEDAHQPLYHAWQSYVIDVLLVAQKHMILMSMPPCLLTCCTTDDVLFLCEASHWLVIYPIRSTQ